MKVYYRILYRFNENSGWSYIHRSMGDNNFEWQKEQLKKYRDNAAANPNSAQFYKMIKVTEEDVDSV